MTGECSGKQLWVERGNVPDERHMVRGVATGWVVNGREIVVMAASAEGLGTVLRGLGFVDADRLQFKPVLLFPAKGDQ